MRSRADVPPCPICHRKFTRSEHLARHERIHTNEKPYRCRCGKAFSRRDLLTRHVRLAHDDVSHGEHLPDKRHEHEALNPPPQRQDSPRLARNQRENSNFSKSPALAKNVADDATTSTNSAKSGDLVQQTTLMSFDYTTYHNDDGGVNSVMPPIEEIGQQLNLSIHAFETEPDRLIYPEVLPDNLDLLWDSFDSNLDNGIFASPSFLNFLDFGGDHGVQAQPSSSVPIPLQPPASDRMITENNPGHSLSTLISRYPSLEPDGASLPASVRPYQDYAASDMPMPHDPFTAIPSPTQPKMSLADYAVLTSVVRAHQHIFNEELKLPSRHALNRYLEGFVSGFHKNLPFLHLPSMKFSAMPLDLILAITSVGAQFRFERRPSMELYKASRALVQHNINQRNGKLTFTTLEDAAQSAHAETSPMANSSSCHSPNFASTSRDSFQPEPDPYQAARPAIEITTIQSMIILITMCTWNHKSMLQDGHRMAAQLASTLREEGYFRGEKMDNNAGWPTFIEVELRRRTVWMGYLVMNLASVVHHSPPKLLNREVFHLALPLSEDEWQASSVEEWLSARSRNHLEETAFGTAYAALFSKSSKPAAGLRVSSLGSVLLIHTVLQRIYLCWESTDTFPVDFGLDEEQSLSRETVSQIETALRRWKSAWESAKEYSRRPNTPGGTLSFNAAALFRISHIRLHLNLGPHRRFETRDSRIIAQAFLKAPKPPPRDGHNALLQCIYSLSIPVRVGLEYVARTQTLDWSIIHCVCSLESAIFLSKWLESLSVQTRNSIDQQEQRLLTTIADILNEAGLGPPSDSHNEPHAAYLKYLAVSVIRLTSLVFKGSPVWELLDVFRDSLEKYANILES